MPINEDEFLESLLPTLTQGRDVVIPPGDDCAALDMGDSLLLLAVDQVAEGTHYFGCDSAHPTDIKLVGRKLVTRNLSDIAAMGGVAKYALTAIGMPKDATAERLQAFSSGIKASADEFGLSLIGGDLTEGPGEFASLTIIGKVSRDVACLRGNALPGDRVFVTGSFGGSFQSGRHLTFQPRVEEGAWLAENQLTRCMIDVSDGLVKDLGRLSQASGLTAHIDEGQVPVHPDSGLDGALYDGEDYELIVAVGPDNVAQLVSSWPFSTPLTDIGTFSKGPAGVYSLTREGLRLDGQDMFTHFQG